MIDIKMDQVAYNRMIDTINKMSEKIKDMSPIWKEFIDYWQNEIMPGVLTTKGKLMGEQWMKYSDKYRVWKQKHFSGKPMLVLTGKLADAMYGGSGWLQRVTKNTLNIGINLDYATAVQEKRPFFVKRDKTIPARALTWLMGKMRDEITKDFK